MKRDKNGLRPKKNPTEGVLLGKVQEGRGIIKGPKKNKQLNEHGHRAGEEGKSEVTQGKEQ